MFTIFTTYLLVKFNKENFDLKDFCLSLDLDYEDVKERWSTDDHLDLGLQMYETTDVNEMARKTLSQFLGKEDILLSLKRKYNLEYILERVVILRANTDVRVNISLDQDILRFMALTETKDDLDYHLF